MTAQDEEDRHRTPSFPTLASAVILPILCRHPLHPVNASLLPGRTVFALTALPPFANMSFAAEVMELVDMLA